jgi:hypothetical protein
MCVGGGGLGGPAGKVCAIDGFEDRGGGALGQDGVGAECSSVTHWWAVC